MALESLVTLILRASQLGFAAIVAGVNGDFLHKSRGADSWALGRFIYTEVVAGLSLLIALIWLFTLSHGLLNWPIDIFISLCWFAAFGLVVDHLDSSACGGAFNWNNVTFRGDPCGKIKAVVAFAFLSAIVWLVSALVDIFWFRRRSTTRHRARVDGPARTHHRRWHRRSYV